MTKIKFLIVILISIFSLSCVQSVSFDDVIGKYKLHGPSLLKEDTLILYEDKSFFHCGYLTKDDVWIREYGKWDETIDGYYELKGYKNLGDFKPVKDVLTREIKIFLDPEHAVYYKKIK